MQVCRSHVTSHMTVTQIDRFLPNAPCYVIYAESALYFISTRADVATLMYSLFSHNMTTKPIPIQRCVLQAILKD